MFIIDRIDHNTVFPVKWKQNSLKRKRIESTATRKLQKISVSLSEVIKLLSESWVNSCC